MTTRRPDWSEPICTGIWGLGYHLPSGFDLVLLSTSRDERIGIDPDRRWPFFLTLQKHRDLAAEQRIARTEAAKPLLGRITVEGHEILDVADGHIADLLDLLADCDLGCPTAGDSGAILSR